MSEQKMIRIVHVPVTRVARTQKAIGGLDEKSWLVPSNDYYLEQELADLVELLASGWTLIGTVPFNTYNESGLSYMLLNRPIKS